MRPDWDEWFLNGCDWAAQRGDCSRRQVGALIVRDNRVLAQGVNGMLPGERGCLAGGCPRAKSDVPPGSQYDHGPGSCGAIHAEANSLLDAARRGCAVEGAAMYISTDPCITCQRLSWQAGILKLVWRDATLFRPVFRGD